MKVLVNRAEKIVFKMLAQLLLDIFDAFQGLFFVVFRINFIVQLSVLMDIEQASFFHE
jgi:hypothetical protein